VALDLTTAAAVGLHGERPGAQRGGWASDDRYGPPGPYGLTWASALFIHVSDCGTGRPEATETQNAPVRQRKAMPLKGSRMPYEHPDLRLNHSPGGYFHFVLLLEPPIGPGSAFNASQLFQRN
jgi:hypothetical protein